MEGKRPNIFSRWGRLLIHWVVNVFIITAIVFIVESLLNRLHWETWEAFSAKMKPADSSVLAFSKQVSPAGLIDAYITNHKESRYGFYFYKWYAPFNVSRACIAMQKRVYLPKLTTPQQSIAYQFDLSGFHDSLVNDITPLHIVLQNKNAPAYVFNNRIFFQESEYLKNACSIDLRYETVLDEQKFDRSAMEWVLVIPESLMRWMKLNWNHADGTSNWAGRIFLFLSLYFAIAATAGSRNSKRDRSALQNIFHFAGWFLSGMFILGLVALLVYLIIGLILLIGGGVHWFSGFVSTITVCGGFVRLFFKEAGEHIGFEGKHKAAQGVRGGFLHWFLKKKK